MAKSKYHPDFPLRAQDYARQGMIDTEIAAKLGISEKTYYDYQKKYPQFLQAIKAGKAPVDVEVENALLKRARGYEYEEVTVEYAPAKKGEKAQATRVKKVTKQVIPDTRAQEFWLKNRRSGFWRDRQDIEFPGITDPENNRMQIEVVYRNGDGTPMKDPPKVVAEKPDLTGLVDKDFNPIKEDE